LLSGTLLVVDDEPLVRELYAATLASSGLQVLTAADGLEAVALFAAHADEIVCVLLDLTMPRMDGVATLEALRQIKPDVRVILCSGYDEQEATQRFAGQGVAGFLHKPYELKSLRAELQRVLEDAG
jgi:CheY-like chemotaxis protein